MQVNHIIRLMTHGLQAADDRCRSGRQCRLRHIQSSYAYDQQDLSFMCVRSRIIVHQRMLVRCGHLCNQGDGRDKNTDKGSLLKCGP